MLVSLIMSSPDLSFEVHSGNDTRFWLDSWLAGGPLSVSSPALFAISRQKLYSIKSMTTLRNGQTIWNFNFSRDLHAFEEEELNILLLIIGDPPDFNNDTQDVCNWKPDPNRSFSVKVFYDHHRVPFPQPPSTEFPYRFIWLSHVPSRVKFFLWTACLNRCLTVDNLNKRGKFIVSRCPLCKASIETLDHLLLHCSFTYDVWNAFIVGSGWSWCMPATTTDFALSWRAANSWSCKGKTLWSVMPIAVWWGV